MYKGLLRDFEGHLATPVEYYLQLDSQTISLNPLIGSGMVIEHNGAKECVLCGRKVTKLYDRGYCFPCARSRPETDLCQVNPHQCHYETCRDQSWGDQHCMIPTAIYLAKSSDIKVGITRNIPSRWVAQGAVEAVLIAEAPTRKVAGEIEQHIAQHIPDKTNWRKMLKSEVVPTAIDETRQIVLNSIPESWQQFLLPPQEPIQLTYPLQSVPTKITSLNLDKGTVTGILLGIKGNYLIFDNGVLNISKYLGYHLTVESTVNSQQSTGVQLALDL